MKKSPLSIRIIYILTSIMYYLAAFATMLGIVLAISLSIGLGIFANDLNLTVNMPVGVDFEEVGTISFFGEKVDVEIVDAKGQIQFNNTPPLVARTIAIPMLIIFPLLFWLVYLFHRFMRNVSEGNIFSARNFLLLRNLSIGLLLVWLFTVIYMQVLKYILFQDFNFKMIEISSSGNWYMGVLMAALFTWVLSHVFLKGLELEEETELTI